MTKSVRNKARRMSGKFVQVAQATAAKGAHLGIARSGHKATAEGGFTTLVKASHGSIHTGTAESFRWPDEDTPPLTTQAITVIPGADGEPAFAAVPWDTWTTIIAELEDRADAAAADAARDDETFPKSVVEQMIAGAHPIKVFREYRGLTQKQLAEAVDTSPVYLSQIERGERTGGMDLLKKLATALDVTLDDIT